VIHASEGDHEVSGVDDCCGVGSEAISTFDPDVWDEETGSTSPVD